MAKADLHVHSKYSDYPSTWLHKAYDSPESFTDTDTVYRQAKQRGMDFVTITDHDDIRGSLELVAAHPDDCFISCEITSYFPEDHCKVHILVYGITGEQYVAMSHLRQNLYDLREYIRDNDIAYSVAHASYDQDGLLRLKHIEQLVLLFDVFEVVNGGSNQQSNQMVRQYLQSLTRTKTNALYEKYAIEPMSDMPWIKGFTGGSDDHCGILVGSAYTQAHTESPIETVEQFIQALKDKKTIGDGRYGSFEVYAVGVFKHLHDYRLHRDTKYRKTKMSQFFELFYTGHRGNWLERFKKSHSLRYLKRKNSGVHKALFSMLKNIDKTRDDELAEKIPALFNEVCGLHDELNKSVIRSFTKNLPEGNIFKLFQNLSNIFPSAMLAVPFVGSMRHQVLRPELKESFHREIGTHHNKKVLWFTDTIDDLNGVSVSLRQMGKQANKLGYNMRLVTCVNEEQLSSPLPKGTINCLPIKKTAMPSYEQLEIYFPSLLGILQKVVNEQPDQIVVSTPGPLGLCALLCAKLLDLPIKGIYHTDFAEQVLRISNEQSLANMIDGVINLFYKQMDYVYVPSNAYINILAERGIAREKLGIFPRGLDINLYCPISTQQADVFRQQHFQSAQEQGLSTDDQSKFGDGVKLTGDFTLLFAGRISEDKNLSLLCDIFELANKKTPQRYNLVIAGDGPDLPNLQKRLRAEPNVHFTGRIDAQELVNWYSLADTFVFPSHTDTFGMVVLEAQACGLPCIVTNSGGPKEIVTPGETGKVLFNDVADEWLVAIEDYYQLKQDDFFHWKGMRLACISKVEQQNGWQTIFDYMLGKEYRLSTEDEQHVLDVEQPLDRQCKVGNGSESDEVDSEIGLESDLESSSGAVLELEKIA